MPEIKVPDSPRFKVWCCLIAFSSVCLASLVSSGNTNSSVEKWVLSAICISLILSIGGTTCYLFIQDKFEGRVEGILTIFLLIFWIGSLPCIMDPNLGIAAIKIPTNSGAAVDIIFNANLYFFAWVSFASTVFLFAHAVSELTGKDITTKAMSPKDVKLVSLLVTSIVVIASAGQFKAGTCNTSSSMCKRNDYAIAVGSFGAVIPVISMVLVKVEKMTALIDLCLSSVIFLLYIFAVGFVTFGSGPASRTVSNLYLSIWIGFLLCLFLAIGSFQYYMKSRSGDDEDSNADSVPEANSGLSKVEEGDSEDQDDSLLHSDDSL